MADPTRRVITYPNASGGLAYSATAPESELPPSSYWYTAPFFLGQWAFVLGALGDRTAAGQAALDCLAEMPSACTSSEWASRRRELAELT